MLTLRVLLLPYFDHDAFRHRTLRLLDAPDVKSKFTVFLFNFVSIIFCVTARVKMFAILTIIALENDVIQRQYEN